ncbi:hypothetical protein AK830_g4778 [Neonectria ditissima]|uniref:receptor protein-tyrosine kinase n=1 Tax=Neonectria ditissima TaxID=78410 RepID=A0A0P7AV29_9HYPO|nr:hypothetical protein AK830_g4778 [Neonectria ditissima]
MALSRLPISLRLLLVAALATSTTSAMPASRLFARADTCNADQVTCPSILPSNFCCGENSTCKALAGGTTAVCCPEGSDCIKIQPITCDVREQDVDNRPNAPIKTTVFNVELETCGDGTCCPFGYTCNNDKECLMDDDQSEAPKGPETSASTTAEPSATSTTDPSSTDAISTTDAPSSTVVPVKSTDSSEPDNSGPATTSIIGGVVGACLLLLVIAIVVFLYIRRRNKRDGSASEKSAYSWGHSRAPSSTGSFGNIISEPIAQPNSYRTDFILKSPSRSSGSSTLIYNSPNATRIHNTPPRIQPFPPRIRISIPNPFDSPNASPNAVSAQPSPLEDEQPRHGTVRLLPIRAMKASSYYSRRPSNPDVQPDLQSDLQREPSSESINVFADPGTVKPRALTRGTTFTDMMDQADLGEVRRGRPYVPGTTPRI